MVYDCLSAFSRCFLWELFFEDMNYNNERIRAALKSDVIEAAIKHLVEGHEMVVVCLV